MSEPSIRDPEREALEALFVESFTALAALHQQMNPHSSPDHFVSRVFVPLARNENISATNALQALQKAQAAGNKAEYWQKCLLASTIYLAQTYQQKEKSRLGQAWYYLVHASYWRGEARAVQDMLDFAVQGVEVVTQTEGASGGHARAQNKFGPAYQSIVELVHEHKPPAGWPSVSGASEEIAQYLRELPKGDPTLNAFKNLDPDNWAKFIGKNIPRLLTAVQFKKLFPRIKLPKQLTAPAPRAAKPRA